jgi:hypothetical protein
MTRRSKQAIPRTPILTTWFDEQGQRRRVRLFVNMRAVDAWHRLARRAIRSKGGRVSLGGGLLTIEAREVPPDKSGDWS